MNNDKQAVMTLIAASVVTHITIHRFFNDDGAGWALLIKTKSEVMQVMTARGEPRQWKSLDALYSFCTDVGWTQNITIDANEVTTTKVSKTKAEERTKHPGGQAQSSRKTDHPSQKAKAK